MHVIHAIPAGGSTPWAIAEVVWCSWRVFVARLLGRRSVGGCGYACFMRRLGCFSARRRSCGGPSAVVQDFQCTLRRLPTDPAGRSAVSVLDRRRRCLLATTRPRRSFRPRRLADHAASLLSARHQPVCLLAPCLKPSHPSPKPEACPDDPQFGPSRLPP